jgi:hypothetical protein
MSAEVSKVLKFHYCLNRERDEKYKNGPCSLDLIAQCIFFVKMNRKVGNISFDTSFFNTFKLKSEAVTSSFVF